MVKKIDIEKNQMDEFMYLCGTLTRILFAKLGLYIGQPIILELITNNPGLTQKELANLGRIKPSTINVMLSRLAHNNLVEIKKDKKNSKLSRVYITEKGIELTKKAIAVRKGIQEEQYKNISEEEKEIFNKLLSKMNKNLEKAIKEKSDNEN